MMTHATQRLAASLSLHTGNATNSPRASASRRIPRYLLVLILLFSAGPSAHAQSAPQFISTGSLNVARSSQTTTLLNNGKVLVAGGFNVDSNVIAAAELYDPTTATFTSTGSLITARTFHSAVLLNNGKVLIAGGNDNSGNTLASAELYDPASGTFILTGSMNTARETFAMTVLNDGRVLVAGGGFYASNVENVVQANAEIYDPSTGIFTVSGPLVTPREAHTATLLDNGQVLIAGGFDDAADSLTDIAELFDPATGAFTATGSLNNFRIFHTATLLNGGKVLLAGGGFAVSPTAELYDPVSGSFSTTGDLITDRVFHTASLLNNGMVLIVGGFDNATQTNSISGVELYDPVAGVFSATASLNQGVLTHTETLLNTGMVLVAGGFVEVNGTILSTLSSAELYQPASLTPPNLASIALAPANPSILVGQSQPLTATGTFSDSTTQQLDSVTWSSSNSAVASVTSDSTNAGNVFALAPGSATITACTGSVCGSTTATVAPPVVLQSIAISPANSSVALGASQQFIATGTYSDASTQDVTATASWSSSAPTVATVSSAGLAQSVGAGQTTIQATFGTISGSTTVTVAPLASATPIIATVTPTAGVAGTQVTISGSGFGATQGSGRVLLGTAYGKVLSWADGQVVAIVAIGSSSGNAQILEGSLASNSLPFSVITPKISSVTPTTGSAGTQVTISGSGFGTLQDNGQVWLGTVPAQVTSWSDAQVVATVAASALSGNAQVLQGGVFSNSIRFTVTGTPPHIASITPNTGAAGTAVTIQGTGFGSSEGSGIASIGGSNASVNSWSDTQVSVTTGASTMSGVLKIQQNGVWSNALTFTVPPPGGATPVTLTPNVISMLVGNTRSIQSLNPQSQPIAGLTWTSSDTTVVTLSSDDPPILSALAPGNVTISAGGASADVTVYPGSSFPTGTVIWSAPGDGSGVTNIMPAVPSPTGVADVFASQGDGSVQALTSDGVMAWTSSPAGFGNSYLPDFQGGLVVLGSGTSNYFDTSIYRLDGITGQAYPAYNSTTDATKQFGGLGFPAIHTDGTIFTIDYSCATVDCSWSSDTTTATWVVGIDPSTGTAKFKVPLANSTVQGTNADSWCFQTPGTYSMAINAFPFNPIIGGDGFSYTSYVTFDATSSEIQPAALLWPQAAYQYWSLLQQDTLTSNFGAAFADYNALLNLTGGTAGLVYKDDLYQTLQNNTLSNLSLAVQDEFNLSHLFEHFCNTTNTNVSKLHILRVGSDGSSSDLIVKQWTESNSLVNNGAHSTGQQSGPMVRATNLNSLTNADTGSVLSWQLMNGSYCPATTDGVCSSTVKASTEYHFTTTAGTAVASDVVMAPAVPGQSAPITPVLQLADGSFVGSVQGQSGNYMVAFDSSGNVNWTVPGYFPQIATADGGIISANGTTFDSSGNATGLLGSLPTQSWLGNEYRLGSVEQVANLIRRYAHSFAALFGGNESDNGTAKEEPQYAQLPSCPGSQAACATQALETAYSSLQTLMTGNCPNCQTFVFSKSQLGIDQGTFLKYLNRSHHFYDATNSHVLAGQALCIPHSVINIFADPCTVSSFDQSMQVKQIWKRDQAYAITKTPSDNGEGLVTFWDPSQVTASLGSTTGSTQIEATIFHEALHGATGVVDTGLIGVPSLQGAFGICLDDDSTSISDYLAFNIFGLSPGPTTKPTATSTCLHW
jgi:hypothetical protein